MTSRLQLRCPTLRRCVLNRLLALVAAHCVFARSGTKGAGSRCSASTGGSGWCRRSTLNGSGKCGVRAVRDMLVRACFCHTGVVDVSTLDFGRYCHCLSGDFERDCDALIGYLHMLANSHTHTRRTVLFAAVLTPGLPRARAGEISENPLFPTDSQRLAAMGDTRRAWEDAYRKTSSHW